MALTIIAVTALAWSQMATVVARTDASVDRREAAIELAASEVERLRLTPHIEFGVASTIAPGPVDGLEVVVDPNGPSLLEIVVIDGLDYTVERFVLDPGSPSWRRLVVTVGWDDLGSARSVRVETAIPTLPVPVVT